MTTEGVTWLQSDMRRADRCIRAFEAGEGLRAAKQPSTVAGDLRVMLLEDLDGSTDHGDLVFAYAVPLEFTPHFAMLVRMTSGRVDPDDEERTFTLSYAGAETPPLNPFSTADEIEEALKLLPGLTAGVVVTGQGTEFGNDDDFKQCDVPVWFVTLSDEIDSPELLVANVTHQDQQAEVQILRTACVPLDDLLDVHPRFPGDTLLVAGSMALCRPDNLGYRVWIPECWEPNE